jgi:hypothetical protein
MARTPRRLDDYRRGQRERDIEREAEMRDRRYSDTLRERIVDDYLREDRDEVMMRVINDPEIVIEPEMMEVINNPNIMVDDMLRPITPAATSSPSQPTIRYERQRLGSGSFAGQFNRGMGFDLPTSSPRKRTRTKSKNDSKMSKALKQANKRLRNKNGSLKKGKTMRDVMKLAHRLARK